MRDNPIRLATGIILVIAGAVWVLQGLNVSFAPQSFMTDDNWWVVWGALAIVIGSSLIWRSRRS